ncbi:9964_t:CDS:2 [Paraglomus occultum]|uniref:9964_t:CDS:1 n=1 Tax=Paraglomus occultum TaxID=144539 RepID=A0A9N9A0L4_9GLOM|nr:9964_t:CDS:2 [Paraglomus occultum]
MLVNRHWCRNVVSFYWCEVISNPTQVETIISLLTPEDRKLIDIDLPEAKIPPAFPYPAFLKTLDIGDLYQTIGTWLVQHYQTDYYHEMDIYNYRRQIAFAILLVYQRYSPNIQKLVIEEDDYEEILLEDMRIQSGADVLLLCQHPIRPLFKNVEILKISSQSYTFDLLNSLADTCHNVVNLHLSFTSTDFIPQSDILALRRLIASQKKLQKFSFQPPFHMEPHYFKIVYKALYNHINSLNHLTFIFIDADHDDAFEGISKLVNLETIELVMCHLLQNVVEPLISVNLPKLTTVNLIDCMSCFELENWRKKFVGKKCV